jgi:glucokinase
VKVLAADVGGTNSRLALFEVAGDEFQLLEEERYRSADFDGLENVVSRFLEGREADCLRAGFGLAGPVRGRRMRTTNLPWVVDADIIRQRFGFERVELLNDLEAIAWGVSMLENDELELLQPGREGAEGNAAVIAAGTGLGQAGLYWDGREWRPFACEGGHTTFAPSTELEWGLQRSLGRSFGHVSWERILSGPGLEAIYRYQLVRAEREPPGWLRLATAEGGAAAAIADAALEGRCERAVATLELFVRLYGVEAGNLALKLNATGGLFVAGGIAPKILPALRRGFVEAFCDKGRMRPLLESMPLRVVMSDRTALLGAARYVLRG